MQSLEEKLEDLDSVSLTIGSQKLIYQYNGKLPFSLVYVLKPQITAIRAIGWVFLGTNYEIYSLNRAGH